MEPCVIIHLFAGFVKAETNIPKKSFSAVRFRGEPREVDIFAFLPYTMDAFSIVPKRLITGGKTSGETACFRAVLHTAGTTDTGGTCP